MTSNITSEDKTNFHLERKDIHLFKESHEIIPNPWKSTSDLINNIASCFSFNEDTFTFEEFRLVIYLALSREICFLFPVAQVSLYTHYIEHQKWQPYQEGLFTIGLRNPEPIKECLRWIGERDDTAAFTEVDYQVPFIVDRNAESLLTAQPLDGIANHITLYLVNRILMFFSEGSVPGTVDRHLSAVAEKAGFFFSYSNTREIFSSYFPLLSVNDTYYIYSGIYLTRENIKSIFRSWSDIRVFVEETLANIWLWSLVQTSFFRNMQKENTLFFFQDYLFSSIIRDYDNFFTNQTYPLFSWDLNWISALRADYFERLPQEVTYGGFRKYLNTYFQVNQKSENALPFEINPLASTKLLDEKSRLVHQLNLKCSDKPQVISTFPLGRKYSSRLVTAFERILLPSLAKEYHIDLHNEGEAHQRDLGILPQAKNLERYYDLFPHGGPPLRQPLETTRNSDPKYSIMVWKGPGIVIYTLDGESPIPFEQAVSYLSSKTSVELSEELETTENSLTEKTWGEADSEK